MTAQGLNRLDNFKRDSTKWRMSKARLKLSLVSVRKMAPTESMTTKPIGCSANSFGRLIVTHFKRLDYEFIVFFFIKLISKYIVFRSLTTSVTWSTNIRLANGTSLTLDPYKTWTASVIWNSLWEANASSVQMKTAPFSRPPIDRGNWTIKASCMQIWDFPEPASPDNSVMPVVAIPFWDRRSRAVQPKVIFCNRPG